MEKDTEDPRVESWHQCFETSARLQIRMGQRLRAAVQLSVADYYVLRTLYFAEQALRLGEISEMLLYSPSRLTFLINSLEKRGLITKAPCESDKRSAIASITEAGKRTYKEAEQIYADVIQKLILTVWTDEEVAAIHALLLRLGEEL